MTKKGDFWMVVVWVLIHPHVLLHHPCFLLEIFQNLISSYGTYLHGSHTDQINELVKRRSPLTKRKKRVIDFHSNIYLSIGDIKHPIQLCKAYHFARHSCAQNWIVDVLMFRVEHKTLPRFFLYIFNSLTCLKKPIFNKRDLLRWTVPSKKTQKHKKKFKFYLNFILKLLSPQLGLL